MPVSIPGLLELINHGDATGVWPNHAERMLARFQGDYDWGDDIRDDILGRFSEGDEEVGLSTLLPSWEDTLWGQSYPHLVNYHRFFVANLGTEARSHTPSPETHDQVATSEPLITSNSLTVSGDFDATNSVIIEGDLTVAGHMKVTEPVVVGGNLTVGGSLVCREMYTGHAIIGDLTVGGPMLVRGELFVAGKTKCPHILVDNGDYVGFLFAIGGLEADVIAERELDEMGKSQAHGEVEVGFAWPPAIVNRDEPAEESLKRLQAVRDDAPEDAGVIQAYVDDWIERLG